MENKLIKQFNIKVSVGSLLVYTIALIVYWQFGINIPLWSLFGMPLFGLLVSVTSFHASKSKSSKKNFSTLLSSLFGIKFFSYIIVVLIFFVLEKEKMIRFSFIVYVFIVYLVNTTILLSSILKYLKNQDSNS